MKYKYEIEHSYSRILSKEEMKDMICRKIVKIILIKELDNNDNKNF